MSHETEVARSGDEMIERVAVTSLAIYYTIGKKISVSERDSGGWLCGTCSGHDRYELGEHKGCAHIQRVKRWAAAHPMQEAAA